MESDCLHFRKLYHSHIILLAYFMTKMLNKHFWKLESSLTSLVGRIQQRRKLFFNWDIFSPETSWYQCEYNFRDWKYILETLHISFTGSLLLFSLTVMTVSSHRLNMYIRRLHGLWMPRMQSLIPGSYIINSVTLSKQRTLTVPPFADW